MVAFSVAFYLIKNHIHIDFKSLLKKGFPKKDNDFRSLLLHWQATEKEKHILVCNF